MRRCADRDRPYLENCTVDASIICSCQVNKGTRWMPWHQEPKKDVAACDKPREVGKQTLIRGFLNAETRRSEPPSPIAECIGDEERTWGTETSKYPQEKKETSIPSVAASESGNSPNRDSSRCC